MMFLQQLDFSLAHRIARNRFVVIVAQYVQNAVDDKQRKFVIDRARMLWRLPLRNCRAQHYIAEQQWHVTRVGRCAIGATTRRHTVQHNVGLKRINRKCQHVGRATTTHVFFVQLSHLAFGHKEQRKLGESANALFAQHVGREGLPSFEIDSDVALLIGAEYLWFALATDSSRCIESRS